MTEVQMINVMIVDDHDMVRDGLKLMLETTTDLAFAGEANSAEAALLLCAQQCPDVILLDLMLPGKGGVEAIPELLARCPQVKIIAITSFDTDGLVQEALQAGAISYLMKDVSIDDLVKAIRAASAGEATLSPEATRQLIAATVEPPQPGHDLTEREVDVLKLLVEGLNNREIAEQLVISRSTVKHHVSSILAKLEASNRSEAVAITLENNLLD